MDYKKLTGDILADSKENSKRIESNLSYAKYLASKSAYDKDVSEMYGVLRNSERKKMKNIENSANLQSALASISDKTDIVESSLLMQYITSSVDFDFSMTETSYILKGSLALKNELAGVSWRGKVLGADIEIELISEATEDAEGISVNNKSFRVTKICNSKTAIDEVTLEFEFEILQDETKDSDVICKITPFIEENETIYFFDEAKEINLREVIALKYYGDKDAPLPVLSDWEVRDATEAEIERAISGETDYNGLAGKTVKMISYAGDSSVVSVPLAPKNNAYIFYKEFAGAEVETVYLPEGMDFLWAYAFCECNSLTSIFLPSTLNTLAESSLALCQNISSIVIPNSVTRIAARVFSSCENLKSVSFGDNLTTIGEAAFCGCGQLRKVVLPESVISIGDFCFCFCENLETVFLPSSLNYVGAQILCETAFYKNEDNWDAESGLLYVGNVLISANKDMSVASSGEQIIQSGSFRFFGDADVSIKDGTRIISSLCFFGCAYIGRITCPDSLRYIGDQSFIGYVYNNNWYYVFSDIALNEGLVEIGESAFELGTNAKSIIIPNSVIEIKKSAFMNCVLLENVTWSMNCSIVKGLVFGHCTSLKTLNIPEGVTSLESTVAKISGQWYYVGPFYDSDIETLFLPKSLKKIGVGIFNGWHGSLTIVYNGTLAEWSNILIEDGNYDLKNGVGKVVTTSGELPDYSAVRYTYNYDAKTAIIEPIESGGTLSMNKFCNSQYSIKALNPESLYIKGFSEIDIEPDSLSECTNLKYIILQGMTGGKWFRAVIPQSSSGQDIFSVFYDGDKDAIDSIHVRPDATRGKIKPLRGTLSDNNSNINYDYSPFDKSVVLSKGLEPNSTLYEIGTDELPCSEVEIIKIQQGITDIDEFALKNFAKFNETDESKKVTCELIFPDSGYDWLHVMNEDPSDRYTLLQNIAFLFGTTKSNYDENNPADYTPYRDDIVVYYDNHSNPTRSIYNTTYFPKNYGLKSVIDRVVNGISWQYNFESSSLKIGADIIEGAASDSTTRFAEELNTARIRVFADSDGIKTVEMSDSITSVGANAFKGMTDLISIHLPDYNDEGGVIRQGLFVIPDSCFEGCTNLETANVPSNTSVIGNRSFHSCRKLSFKDNSGQDDPQFLYGRLINGEKQRNLRTIGERAFYDCRSIGALDLPEGLIEMGESTFKFAGSFSLMNTCRCLSVVVPGSLKVIPSYAFDGFLANAQSIVLNDGIEEIGGQSFGFATYCAEKDVNMLIVPDSVTKISAYSFYYCQHILNIKFSMNVKEIAERAFYECVNLKNFYADNANSDKGLCLDGAINAVDDRAFCNCSSIEQVNIGSRVLFLGNYFIQGCNRITRLEIPPTVTDIGNRFFGDNSQIKYITIPFIGNNRMDSVTTLSHLFLKDKGIADSYRRLLEVIVEPPGTTQINVPAHAFYCCESLTSVTLNGNIASIGTGAFGGCSSLVSLTIPTTVNQIGLGSEQEDGILQGCTSLESLSVPFIGNKRNGDSGCVSSTQNIAYFFYGMLNGTINGTIAALKNDYSDFEELTVYDFVPENAGCDVISETVGGKTVTTYVGANIKSLRVLRAGPQVGITVGANAFHNCYNLSHLKLASGGLSIGDGAFCLDNATYSQGIETPTANDSIIESLSYTCAIGDRAFYGQKRMSRFCRNYNASLYSTIGESAFENCESLLFFGYIYFSHSVKLANANSTSTYYAIRIYSLGESAFKNCTKLQNVELQFASSDKEIPESCFEGCTSIMRVWFPTGTTGNGYPASSIGNRAFYGCTSLIEFPIPESVSAIGDSAFEDCANLHLIEFNNKANTSFANGYSGVKTIGEKAFKNCTKLCYIIDGGKTTQGVVPYTKDGCAFSSSSDSNRFSISRDSYTGLITHKYYDDIGDRVIYYNSPSGTISSLADFDARTLQLITWYPVKMAIPLGITSVGEEAFMCCASAPLSELPESYGFENFVTYNGIVTRRDVWLHIPFTLEEEDSIGEGAFSGIQHMTRVRYCDEDYDSWASEVRNSTRYYYRASRPYTDGYYHNGLYKNIASFIERANSYSNLNRTSESTQFSLISYFENAKYAERMQSRPTTSTTGVVCQIDIKSFCAIENESLSLYYFTNSADSSTQICASAFYNCQNLRRVHILKPVTFQNDIIFKNCPNINMLEFFLTSQKDNTYISSKDQLYSLFDDGVGDKLETLVVWNPNLNGYSISLGFVAETKIKSLSIGSTSSDYFDTSYTYWLSDSMLANSNVEELYINFVTSYSSSKFYGKPCFIPASLIKNYKNKLKVVELGHRLSNSTYATYSNSNYSAANQDYVQAFLGLSSPAMTEEWDENAAPFRNSSFLEKVMLNVAYGTNTSQYNKDNYWVKSGIIGKNMFRGCGALKKISTALDTAQNIGDYAFCDCSKLESVNSASLGVINTTGTIGKHAFSDAFSDSSANTVYLSGYSYLSIGDDAFSGVSKLTGELCINNVNAAVSIGENAFKDTGINALYLHCYNLTIEENAFENLSFINCSQDTSHGIYIWARTGKIEIGEEAFKNCIFDVTRYYGVCVGAGNDTVTIGSGAFDDCKFNTESAYYSLYVSSSSGVTISDSFKGCVFNGINNDDITASASQSVWNIPIYIEGPATVGKGAFNSVKFTNKTRILQENLGNSDYRARKAIAIQFTGDLYFDSTIDGSDNNELFSGATGKSDATSGAGFCIKVGGIAGYPIDTTSAWAKLTGHIYNSSNYYNYGTKEAGLLEYAGAPNPIAVYGSNVRYNSSGNTRVANFYPPLS